MLFHLLKQKSHFIIQYRSTIIQIWHCVEGHNYITFYGTSDIYMARDAAAVWIWRRIVKSMTSNISDRLWYILFADDTNINVFASRKSLAEISKVINTELILINEWLKINKLYIKYLQNTIHGHVISRKKIRS